MELEELRVYQRSMELGEKIWELVDGWSWFQKDTVGKQLVRSVDSVAANLSEGFGRYHYKESKNFSYFFRGSLYETKTWLTKAHKRNLISEEEYGNLIQEIKEVAIQLNNYIKSIGRSSKSNEY